MIAIPDARLSRKVAKIGAQPFSRAEDPLEGL
jgi:hypothetical protein